MGRLTALLLATSAGLLVLAGAQRLLPACRGRAPRPRRRPGAPPAAPFAAGRPPAWSTTDATGTGCRRACSSSRKTPRPTPSWPASTCRRRGRRAIRPTTARPRGPSRRSPGATRTTPWPPSSPAPCSWPATTSPPPWAAGSGRCALAPRSAAGTACVGDAALELGQYERAVEAFQAMIDLRPDLASYSRVAYARELHGDLPGAIEAMQRAVNAGAPRTEGTNWARVQLGHLLLPQRRPGGGRAPVRARPAAAPRLRPRPGRAGAGRRRPGRPREGHPALHAGPGADAPAGVRHRPGRPLPGHRGPPGGAAPGRPGAGDRPPARGRRDGR